MPPPRTLLVAVGDLHGHARALDRLLAALDRRHRILSPSGALRSGVTLVTMGDHVDRGSHALEIVARLRRMARGAGRVVSLLGNHELLALESLEDAARLAADPMSEDPIAEYEACTVHGANGGGAFVREFGRSPIAALRAYVARMAPTGDVGRWIRSLRPAHLARVGDRRVLFTHGDVPESLRDPERLGRALERARRLVRGAMPGTWEDPCLAGDESVFWDRSFLSLAVDPDGDPGAVCRALEVDHVVTGHTPHQRVSVYGDRIFRVDVGMTPAYGENEPEALVFTDEGATALSASGRERSLVRFDAAIAA